MADAGNAPQLRTENLQLHQENMKIQKELDESRKALEDYETRIKSQGEKDGAAIRDLEHTLHTHLEEITKLDKYIISMLNYLLVFILMCTFFLFFVLLTYPSFQLF